MRFWDLNTESPLYTCRGCRANNFVTSYKLLCYLSTLVGHKDWVLFMAWSPDGKSLASASKDGEIRLWDPLTGKANGKALTGHHQVNNSKAVNVQSVKLFGNIFI